MTPRERAEQIYIACNGPQGYDWRNAIESAIAAAVADAYENAAKVADQKARYYVHLSAVTSAFRDIAAAIRERGEKG